MIKILYAASNNLNAKIQLERFIKAVSGSSYTIKIAAYKQSSPNINIDWTLDCLLDIFNVNNTNLNNDNFQIYFDQIKSFNPDLIISDLEYFTSYAANILNINLWQCSSSIINFAFTKKQKYNMGIFKNYSYILNKNPEYTQRIVNIIDNSNYNFIYSHFGDIDESPQIQEKFEWVRPYHKTGKVSLNCRHNIVATALKNNKQILSKIKNYNDIVLFSNFIDEQYKNIILKDIENYSEYFCNIQNSKIFICEGQTSFLADAYYNNKKSIIILDYTDPECIVNSTISNKLGLSENFTNNLLDNEHYIQSNLNPNVKYLHEKILDFI